MIPLLAPLLGSLAGSLLPATVGTGIAGALGLKGAAAGLVAAAAPKAIGAGIGTLLAGGDLGDAALNAVGFGAAGAAGSALSGGLSGTPGVGAPAMSPRPMMRPDMLGAAAPSPAVPTEAAASAIDPQMLSRLAQSLGGGQQPQQAPQAVPAQPAQPRDRASENPMLASIFQQPGSPMLSSMPSPAIPSVGSSSMMPAAVGIGSLPVGGQQPMSNNMMLAGMSPNQSNMVNQYLSSRNMVGFV
jgi:hypothetical protein